MSVRTTSACWPLSSARSGCSDSASEAPAWTPPPELRNEGLGEGTSHGQPQQTGHGRLPPLQLDLDALPMRDRAVLRILTRADRATASQVARLIYGRERTAQERLLWLMHRLARSGDLTRRTPLDRPSIRSRIWDSNPRHSAWDVLDS